MQDDDFIVVTPCNALSLFFDYAVFQFIACYVICLAEEDLILAIISCVYIESVELFRL